MADNIKLLKNYIDFCSERNKVIGKNIANVGTKKYNREDVMFKDVLSEKLASSMKATSTEHYGSRKATENGQAPFEVFIDYSDENNSGVNNVDIESEMASLAENTINFKFASKKIGAYYRTMREVIKGGGAG